MSIAAAPSAAPATMRPLPTAYVPYAATMGAALTLAGDAYHLFILHDRPTQAGTVAYAAHGLALMLGLLLLLMAALSVARPHPLTRAGLPTLVIGTGLVVGDVWAESIVLPGVLTGTATELLGHDTSGRHLAFVIAAFALFATGWLLFALTMRPTDGAVTWLLIIGAVLAFLPIPGSYVLLATGACLVILRAHARTGQHDASEA